MFTATVTPGLQQVFGTAHRLGPVPGGRRESRRSLVNLTNGVASMTAPALDWRPALNITAIYGTSDTGDFRAPPTAPSPRPVASAPLSATGANFRRHRGASPFNGVVATFTNADPFGSAASYSAVIAWGDGSTSVGTITGTGTLTVSGSHTFADPIDETVHVTISHNLGYTTTATTTGTAFLTDLVLRSDPGPRLLARPRPGPGLDSELQRWADRHRPLDLAGDEVSQIVRCPGRGQ